MFGEHSEFARFRLDPAWPREQNAGLISEMG
jgi:hypothetical protein